MRGDATSVPLKQEEKCKYGTTTNLTNYQHQYSTGMGNKNMSSRVKNMGRMNLNTSSGSVSYNANKKVFPSPALHGGTSESFARPKMRVQQQQAQYEQQIRSHQQKQQRYSNHQMMLDGVNQNDGKMLGRIFPQTAAHLPGEDQLVSQRKQMQSEDVQKQMLMKMFSKKHEKQQNGKNTEPQQISPNVNGFSSPLTSQRYNEIQKSALDHTSHSNNNDSTDGMDASNKYSELTQLVLDTCDWPDKLLHVTRSLLGGSNANGFLKAASSVQRVKKQILKQNNKQNNNENNSAESEMKKGISSQEQKQSKLEVNINPRTVEKIRRELIAGMSYCASLIKIVQVILDELQPVSSPAAVSAQPNENSSCTVTNKTPLTSNSVSNLSSSMHPHSNSLNNSPTGISQIEYLRQQNVLRPSLVNSSNDGSNNMMHPTGFPTLPYDGRASMMAPLHHQGQHNLSSPRNNNLSNNTSETVAAGNSNGSTLRKHRSKTNYFHVNDNNNNFFPTIIEEDPENGRKLNRKEIIHKNFEILRFRSLNQGDYVAARLSNSRELYIVVHVVQSWNFPENSLTTRELVTMTEAKRAAVFKEKVLVQDVEDLRNRVNEQDVKKRALPIPRYNILPLPRSYNEASNWGSKFRKGFRVYAMYPSTTSLYCATVIDNTTYCRGDDDIIVVEFDGDEDEFGKLPQRHIPARFVTLIPSQDPAALKRNKKKKPSSSNQNKKQNNSTPSAALASISNPTMANNSNMSSIVNNNNNNRHDSSSIGFKSSRKRQPSSTTDTLRGNTTTKKSNVNKDTNDSSDDVLNCLINQMAYGEWSDNLHLGTIGGKDPNNAAFPSSVEKGKHSKNPISL